MKIEPTFQKTKSGDEFLIREATISDAKNLISCIKSYLKNHSIPITPEEFNDSIEDMEAWIAKLQDGKNNLLLLAEYQDKIIGNIDLTVHHRSMLSHTGYIGMGVHEEYQGQGIGSLLLDKVIEWSESCPDIEILWLQVFGNNEKGIKIYKRKGFQEEGRQKDFIKNPEGKYIDNIIMTRKVSVIRD